MASTAALRHKKKAEHIPGDRKDRGVMDHLYEQPTTTKFTSNLRVPASCDPAVPPAPENPGTSSEPVNLSASWGVRKAHMTSDDFAAMEAPTVDPARAGRKGHSVLPGQFNVSWGDLEDELGFKITPAMINFGAIGEGCSNPSVLNKHVNTANGSKYYGMCDNRKLWYTKEPAEMLFHEFVKK
ncbi:hypothetical protein T492DRAFT_957141 [Pavlovales sp. CCMP2436]|nr:hypothetical protein T492DRAFT_957141 [Pavlovales sp. CCMP2436]